MNLHETVLAIVAGCIMYAVISFADAQPARNPACTLTKETK
jgi:hypothetical protein